LRTVEALAFPGKLRLSPASNLGEGTEDALAGRKQVLTLRVRKIHESPHRRVFSVTLVSAITPEMSRDAKRRRLHLFVISLRSRAVRVQLMACPADQAIVAPCPLGFVPSGQSGAGPAMVLAGGLAALTGGCGRSTVAAHH
jgi:hypothetical protein